MTGSQHHAYSLWLYVLTIATRFISLLFEVDDKHVRVSNLRYSQPLTYINEISAADALKNTAHEHIGKCELGVRSYFQPFSRLKLFSCKVLTLALYSDNLRVILASVFMAG